MANKIIQLKDGNDNLYPTPPTDYIIEQGTSGIWTYRKWASGIAECWGNYSNESKAFSAEGAIYSKQTYSGSLPGNLFTEVKSASVLGQDGSVSWSCISALSKTSITIWSYATYATTRPTKVYMHVQGLWKALSQVGGN